MNFIHKLIPSFLKEIDRKLLIQSPHLWASKLLYVLWFLGVFALLQTVVAFNITQNLNGAIDLEDWLVYTYLPAGIGFIYWLIIQGRYMVNKQFGKYSVLQDYGFVFRSIFIVFLFLASANVFPFVMFQRAISLYENEEYSQDVYAIWKLDILGNTQYSDYSNYGYSSARFNEGGADDRNVVYNEESKSFEIKQVSDRFSIYTLERHLIPNYTDTFVSQWQMENKVPNCYLVDVDDEESYYVEDGKYNPDRKMYESCFVVREDVVKETISKAIVVLNEQVHYQTAFTTDQILQMIKVHDPRLSKLFAETNRVLYNYENVGEDVLDDFIFYYESGLYIAIFSTILYFVLVLWMFNSLKLREFIGGLLYGLVLFILSAICIGISLSTLDVDNKEFVFGFMFCVFIVVLLFALLNVRSTEYNFKAALNLIILHIATPLIPLYFFVYIMSRVRLDHFFHESFYGTILFFVCLVFYFLSFWVYRILYINVMSAPRKS